MTRELNLTRSHFLKSAGSTACFVDVSGMMLSKGLVLCLDLLCCADFGFVCFLPPPLAPSPRALHGIVLYCFVMRWIALHCIALHCIALHCIALHCIAQQ